MDRLYDELRTLEQKGRRNWTQEDWEEWSYIKNALGELEYYEARDDAE